PREAVDVEPHEAVPPGAHRAGPSRGAAGVGHLDLVVADGAAVVPGQVDGGADVGALGDVGRLEPDDDQRGRAVEVGTPTGLGRVEDAEVGGPQLGLHDGPD